MDNLFATVIGAAGGFAVWLLNWLWILYSERRLRIRIRTMLSIELEENLEALREFLSTAQKSVTLNKSPLTGIQSHDQFFTFPLPTWKHDIWAGLTASIPLALKEQEIKEVHHFHFKLDELTRQRIDSQDTLSRFEWSRSFEDQINVLLKRGNPLKQ